MKERTGEQAVVSFGPFELHLPSGELRKFGLRVRIPGQPLAILTALVGQPGSAVSREDLRKRLWPDGIHVDYDHNLNKAVNRLRDTLGDSAESPRYIETLPGRGYRLLVPVTRGENLPAAVVPALPAPPAPGRRRFLNWRWLTGGLTAALLSGATLWLALSPRPRPATTYTAMPLTALVGRETSPSLSPDGSRVAFVWEGESSDNIDVYTLSIGASRPVRLTRHAAADYSPVWSPDGKWIAFLRDLDLERSGVYLVSAAGAVERHLRTIKSPPRGYSSFSIPRRALAWSRDGRFLIASDMDVGEKVYSLVRIAVQDGTAKRLFASTQPVRGDVAPAVSFDGGTLAFVRGGEVHTGLSVCTVAIGPELEPRGRVECAEISHSAVDSLTWSGRARELIVSAAMSMDSERVLFVLPAGSPERAEPLLGAGVGGVEPVVSPEANRLVYSKEETKRSSIWHLDLARPGAAPSLLNVTTAINSGANISPDGRRLAFRSLRSGKPEVWISAVDGSDMRPIAGLGAETYGSPQWSPDGRQLVLVASLNHEPRLCVVDPATGAFRRLDTQRDAILPTWSRDGRTLYFSSVAGGGREIFTMPAQGGPTRQLTHGGGAFAQEAADGRTVFVSTNARFPQLLEMGADGRVRREVVPALANRTAFAITPQGVYYFAPPGPKGRTALRFRDLSSGADREVAWIERPVERGLSVSGDGKKLVFSQVDAEESSLMVIEGFR